jgi:hypothetical protein
MLYFDPGAMVAARDEVLEGATEGPSFAAPVFADEQLRRAFDAAFASAMGHDESGHEMIAETAVLRLVAQLAVNLSPKNRKSSHSTVSIRRTRDRIDADPAAPLTLTSLAAELVGTWAAATWAIAFYQRRGFVLVSAEQKTALLKTYWTIPERQIETSVVLANPALAS